MVESTSSLQAGANAVKLVTAIGGPDWKSCTSLKMKGVQISGNSGMFQIETLSHFDRKALGRRLSSYNLSVADEIDNLYNTCVIDIRARLVSGSEMDEIICMQSVVKVSKERLGRSMDRELVILNLQNSTYYGLNSVGAFVWSLMQRATSVKELRDAMLKKYEVDEQRCERDLLDLLKTMHSEGLIEVQRGESH